MMSFIAHTDTPRTFADKKGATKAIKRDLLKHDAAHGDVLLETGYEVQPSGDRFGVVVFVDIPETKAKELVGPELSGYVIDPQVEEEKKADTVKAPRRKGQVNVSPTAPLFPCRANSKQQAIVLALAGEKFDVEVEYPLLDPKTGEVMRMKTGLTSSDGGATLEQLRLICVKKDGTPWDDNSIRSAMYYDVKDKGYGVTTVFDGDTPVYRIVLPAGYDAPLAAKTPKS